MSVSLHLSRNLAIVRQRWPSHAHRLQTCEVDLTVERPTNTPEPSLRVDGVLLASGFDRRGEAALQARLIPHDAETAWIYGAALGDLPRLLLSREAIRTVHVVVLNWTVFRAALTHTDQSDWLADDRIELVDGGQERLPQSPFAAAPACLRLASAAAAPLRDHVQLRLDTPFIRKRYASAIDWAARGRANAARVCHDRDVRDLYGMCPGASFLVAGSGPTLLDDVPALRALHRRPTPLIATYDALPRLLEIGLQPAVVVGIGPEARVHAGLAELAEIPLVYFPAVPPDVLLRWPGPRFAAYPDRDEHPFLELQARYDRGRLFAQGSALHVAVDLAVKMGAAEAVLFGADFSTLAPAAAGDRETAASSHDANGTLLDGYGRSVSTTPHLRGALRDLETYLQAHPQVRVVNASRRGARIAHTDYLDEVDA